MSRLLLIEISQELNLIDNDCQNYLKKFKVFGANSFIFNVLTDNNGLVKWGA